MSKHFFDYDDGDFAYAVSDNMAIDSDGNMMMRMGDNMAMDMDTGIPKPLVVYKTRNALNNSKKLSYFNVRQLLLFI